MKAKKGRRQGKLPKRWKVSVPHEALSRIVDGEVGMLVGQDGKYTIVFESPEQQDLYPVVLQKVFWFGPVPEITPDTIKKEVIPDPEPAD